MPQEDRMRYRRLRLPLRFGERRTLAALLDDVREDHHLRHARLLVARRADVDLQVAELRTEVAQLAAGQRLARKAKNAMPAERREHGNELLLRQRLPEVEALDRCTQRF